MGVAIPIRQSYWIGISVGSTVFKAERLAIWLSK
jgi:hypothetical protein